ncbi:hypothetical protein [Arthrobacter sp. EpRS71]|uniref:hypothetical protein n=1 Tax=Arthrobacter sp. EpRS71 TaxID=1743141 RepID=UPI00074908F3|nr:hypothetical protein [Arthrobacter sp. EpRS71]KUM36485.1 hypothetical protein AR689_21460 [Arthrobacter sp. EpRS71]
MDPVTLIQPVIGPLIGGALTLFGGYVASKRTDKATRVTERRKLSHDSAREITSQLAVALVIGRRRRIHDSFDLTQEGQDELAEVLAKIEHHARYIDDAPLRDAVAEAVSFLRPPPDFEILLGKSVTGIIEDVNRWIGPLVRAHVLCDKLPTQCEKPPNAEPDFLNTYRSKHQEAQVDWEETIAGWEALMALEAENSKKAAVAQEASDSRPDAGQV